MSDCIIPPEGDATASSRDDTPAYVPTKSPGRIALGGIAADLLGRYGLSAEDIPRAPGSDSPVVTVDEVVADLDRRGHTVERVWERPPLPEHVVRPQVRALLALGAHLIELQPWTKTPANFQWQDTPALTEDESVAVVSGRGGNLGINMLRSGPNGWVALDSECRAVTKRLIAAGLVPTVMTANGQNPDSNKAGGAHFHLPLPVGVNPHTLKSWIGLELPSCGKLDVLQGARFAVAPCSRLITSPDTPYTFAGKAPRAVSAGPVTGYTAERQPILNLDVWVPPPTWLMDDSVPLPIPGLEPLHGSVAPRKPKPKRSPNPSSDRITQEVDAVTWDVWLDDDPRVEILGIDGCCGCDVFHWVGASTPRSGILHDGCDYGYGVHAFSGTLVSELGSDHVSRLDFAAWLHDVTIAAAANRVGISLSAALGGLTREDIEEALAERDLRVLPGGGEGGSFTPPRLSTVPRIGTVGGGVVDGTAALAPTTPEPAAAVGTEAASDIETAETETTEEADPHTAAAARADVHMAAAMAPELLDQIFCTDPLREIRRRAEGGLVSPMVALNANLQATLSVIPSEIKLPRVVGKKNAALNLITVAVDESGGGKGGLTSVDINPVPAGYAPVVGLPDEYIGLRRIPPAINVGSGEAISGAFSHTVKGEGGKLQSENHTDSVRLAWDEVSKVTAVRDRKGSTIESELCLLFSGERLGSHTKTNACWTEEGSYRAQVAIAAQRVTAVRLLWDEFTGLVQRLWWVSAEFRLDEDQANSLRVAITVDEDGWFVEPDAHDDRIRVVLPEWPSDNTIPVAGTVAAQIRSERIEHGRGRKAHPWDRHELVIRLRLAAAGAAMHGECGVSQFWWDWAGLLMVHSKHVRAAVIELRSVTEVSAAAEAGKVDAVRAESRASAQWRGAVNSTEAWALKRGRWFTESAAKKGAGPGFRKDHMGEILAALFDVGRIISGASGDKILFRHCDVPD